MKRIDTLEDLRKEKKRLRLRVQTLEGNIRNDWENVKLSLAPANVFFKTINNSVVGNKPNLLNETLNTGIDLFLRRVLLRNRGLIVKLIVPYLVKNFTGNYIKSHRNDIISWFRNKISTVFSRNGADKHYDQSTADVNSATW